MSRDVLIRPRAEADLAEIWSRGAATWSRVRTVSYFEGLRAAIDLLRDFPENAPPRPEFSPTVRFHPYRAHILVFTATGTTIEIVRVLHARPDWQALLAEYP